MGRCHTIQLADSGEILYWPNWLADNEASKLLEELSSTLPWLQRQLKMFGKVVAEPRLSAWIGDPGAKYTYSGRAHAPTPWLPALEVLRTRLEKQLGQTLNSVLANLYRNERDSMGWHADDERELGTNPTIVSVSLGQTRRFWLKHAAAETIRLELGHGSLLVMRGSTQHHWKHSVPKETSHREPRINLTFRHILEVARVTHCETDTEKNASSPLSRNASK